MHTIAIFTLTSGLHAEAQREVCEEPFIQNISAALNTEFEFHGNDFTSFGTHGADLIYVRTGGTEGMFKKLNLPGRIKLLTSGESNSLAASMEILSYLRSEGRDGEILHGSPEQIAERILSDGSPANGAERFIRPLPEIDLGGVRLGVVGHPSDWLISSNVDYTKAAGRLNAELVDIPIQELIDSIHLPAGLMRTFAGSEEIHRALKALAEKYSLGGLTLRCFDLLDTLHNTGCLALARLNAEGIPASCEGDIPALLTMAWNRKESGCPGFQCNLSRIDGDRLLFAHCTAPLTMLRSYEYATHFESGIGTAIKGELECRDVEIVKIAPDLERCVCIPGKIVGNPSEPNLCRTQVMVEAPGAADYFLHCPLANHHIIKYLK